MGDKTAGRTAKQYLPDVRLCVTGGAGVGKSAITVRLLTRRFIGEYQRDTEQTYRALAEFGPDTITYELKDTGTTPDMTSLAAWPTCVAVVYAINDIASFAAASKLLEDIDAVHQMLSSKSCAPFLALIANKKDLEHFRKVRRIDGRNLAGKHGATFWEVSASEDYYSILEPLHSLIVESFLNSKQSNSSSSSSGNEDKILNSTLSLMKEEFRNLLRRGSAPVAIRTVASAPTSPAAPRTQQRRFEVNTRNSPAPGTPSSNPVKRRRSKLLKTKPNSLDKDTATTLSLSPRPPTPPTPIRRNPPSVVVDNDNCSPSKITIEITDMSNDFTSAHERDAVSLNFSKDDDNKLKQNSAEEKQPSADMGITKSRSYTDLKQARRESVSVNIDVNCDSIGRLFEQEDLKEARKGSASTFGRDENSRKCWNKLKKKLFSPEESSEAGKFNGKLVRGRSRSICNLLNM